VQCCGESPEKKETEALHRHKSNQTTQTNGEHHNNHHKHKVLTESELCKRLDEGWDLVMELSNGKLAVRRDDY